MTVDPRLARYGNSRGLFSTELLISPQFPINIDRTIESGLVYLVSFAFIKQA